MHVVVVVGPLEGVNEALTLPDTITLRRSGRTTGLGEMVTEPTVRGKRSRMHRNLSRFQNPSRDKGCETDGDEQGNSPHDYLLAGTALDMRFESEKGP